MGIADRHDDRRALELLVRGSLARHRVPAGDRPVVHGLHLDLGGRGQTAPGAVPADEALAGHDATSLLSVAAQQRHA
jgi:hypothetical protein